MTKSYRHPNRRTLLKATATGVAASSLAAPAIAQSAPIRWRLQTYAGAELADFVVRPAIEAFNRIAKGQMVIELYVADQLVGTSELFDALRYGTIDAVQSDDDSMASPTEVTAFGGYFPFATRFAMDVPVLFERYGLKQIWEEEYAKVGVKHISAGAWDPCHIATRTPIRSLEALRGKRIFTFPTAGRFLERFGVEFVSLPWDEVTDALKSDRLDGLAWSGITEAYTVGWADHLNYFLTNNLTGAWIGHFFCNIDRWNALPDHLKTLVEMCFDQSHYSRMAWYWGGEADLRVSGKKLNLTSIADEEWAQVETAAIRFWDEIAAESEVKARVVDILRQFQSDMERAGKPYRNA